MLPFKLRFKASIWLLAAVVAALIVLPSLASAMVIDATATAYRGEPITATLMIDDESQPGDLVVTLSIDEGALIGDLRSLYMNISDESLLPGLSISGANITQSRFDANSVRNFGTPETGIGNRPEACNGNPGGCDFGVEIGTVGTGSDDIQSVTFILSHVTQDLTVDLLADQFFTLRANSVGPLDGIRSGASKLFGLVVVPEPSTAILMLLGLAGLTAAGRVPVDPRAE